MFIWRKSYAWRNINFIFQWLWLLSEVAGLTIFVWSIKGLDLAGNFCSKMNPTASPDDLLSNLESCQKHITIWLYVIFSVLVLVCIPLQLFFIAIFWAYRDELEDENKESIIKYTPLPENEDETPNIV